MQTVHGCGVSYKQHGGQRSLEEKSLTPSGIALAAWKCGGSSRLPVQASNKDSGVQGGEETEMTLWSSQCRQGSHWSPREQGSSGVSALSLPGVFVASVWGLN